VEFAMRYLFWVVLLVIVALAGGFYFLTVPGLEAEKTELQNKISEQADILKGLAEKKEDVKTRSHVDATKAYAAKLMAQDQAVKAQLKGKALTVDPRFKEAPTDPLRFDEWLIGVRKEVLGQAEKAGVVLPLNFAQQWLDQDKITIKSDRDVRLEKVLFIAEVIRLLCEVKGNVSVLEFAKVDQPETAKEVSVGVYSLDSLDRLDSPKTEVRVKVFLTKAFSSA